MTPFPKVTLYNRMDYLAVKVALNNKDACTKGHACLKQKIK